MAKLKAPLMSLGARGQLGKALVFFPWKGLNLVREYVIPSNPKTTLQTTQRGYLTTIVDAIHAAQALAAQPLVEADQVAYSALSSAKGKIMTWFNQACKLGVLALGLSDGYTIYRTGAMVNTVATDFRPSCYVHDNGVLQVAAGKFFLGTSKTNLVRSIAATVVAGSHVLLDPGEGWDDLTVGVKYFWQFRPDAADPCEGSDSGIYYAVAT